MLVDRKEFKDKDGSLGYVESVFTSDNILKTIYFNKSKKLYISFSRGGTYSYTNFTQEKFNEMEKSDSQGVFFHKKINKCSDHYCSKEFNLLPDEITEIRNIIAENTEEDD